MDISTLRVSTIRMETLMAMRNTMPTETIRRKVEAVERVAEKVQVEANQVDTKTMGK